MRNVRFLSLALLMTPLVLAADTVKTYYFQAPLSPSSQVAPVMDTEAVGEAQIAIHVRKDDSDSVVYAVVDFDVKFFVGQPETLIGLHIHKGERGANGPIVISSQGLDFSTPPVAVPNAGEGRLWRQAVIPGDDSESISTIYEIMANPSGFYVNLHAMSHPPGFIRGQLVRTELTMLQMLAADLTAVADKIDSLTEAELASNEELAAELAAVRTLARQIAARLGVLFRGQ